MASGGALDTAAIALEDSWDMTTVTLARAGEADSQIIWEILQNGIAQRRREGSTQWQNGYPNEQTVRDDIEQQRAYLLVQDGSPIACAAIIFGAEPAYGSIEGQWLTDGKYAVVHRMARSSKFTGKGVASKFLRLIEDLCIERGMQSIRLDTSFDNASMRKTLGNLEYRYCGEIFHQGASRMAYEKVLGMWRTKLPT